jgi:hypothetical protein
VALNGRYMDALALLVREHGRLVTKDRFLEEVWRGVPVTDEALTQCIRTLRRQLGDNAASPRFIETAPKHGYRFVAPVEWVDDQRSTIATRPESSSWGRWRTFLVLGGAGTAGGGLAGLFGGVIYGFLGASNPLQPALGAASVLLALVCLTLLVGLAGGAGVGFGIAATAFGRRTPGPAIVAGGAIGGLLVGAVVKLIATDAFSLLLGHSPGDITGAPEGAVLGAAVGLAAWLSLRNAPVSFVRGKTYAAVAGAAAGLLIILLGGRLMGGSLDLLAERFTSSRLRLDAIGAFLGERSFGPLSQAVSGAFEGMLFAAGVVGAMLFAQRLLDHRQEVA